MEKQIVIYIPRLKRLPIIYQDYITGEQRHLTRAEVEGEVFLACASGYQVKTEYPDYLTIQEVITISGGK